MSQALKRAGVPAAGLTAAQARIYSDGTHLEADVEQIDTTRLDALLAAGTVPAITGGQAVSRTTLDFTTLGRGGSDTSGVAVGVALGVCRVEIFTDVDGVASADPRLVAGARILARVSYAAMYELARFGAKVVHPRALADRLERAHAHRRAGRRSRMLPARSSTTSRTTSGGWSRRPSADGHPRLASRCGCSGDSRGVGAIAPGDEPPRQRYRDIIAGATDDKAEELRDALKEAAIEPVRSLGRCCWMSVVGEAGALGEQHLRWMTRFAEQGVDVAGCELSDQRITYVVAEGARSLASGCTTRSAGWPAPLRDRIISAWQGHSRKTDQREADRSRPEVGHPPLRSLIWDKATLRTSHSLTSL